MKIKKFGRIFKVQQWKGERLGKVFGIDTETSLITIEQPTPDLVITTAYDGKGIAWFILNKDVHSFLEIHKNHTMIFHNAAFDLRVLTKATGFLFWDMIEGGCILDSALLFKLMRLATKGFTPPKWSLDYCVSVILSNVLPKDNAIRLTFGQYIVDNSVIPCTVNYKAMSREHIKYAILDPVATFLVYEEIMKVIKTLPTTTNLAHTIHLMGDLALDDIRCRGIGVDLEYTNKLRDELQEVLDAEAEILATYGWTRGKKGNQEVYNKVIDFLGFDLPKTENGYSMEAEKLEPYKNDPFIKSLLRFLETEKTHSFLNELRSERVYPWYDSLKNTARTSCRKPNLQNPPRKGGIRECFIAKKGHVFCDADYGSIEMYTIAEIMMQKGYGRTMFDVLNDGNDPHIFAATIIYNIPAEEVTKDQRQAAKIANYGFLANMSASTFVDYAGQFGITFTLEEAENIKKGWVEAYPEVKEFWKQPYKHQGMFISRSGFMRANCSYTAWLNTHFQGAAAEGIKIAMYLCYKEAMPMVGMIHDELIIEVPENESKEQLAKLEELMIRGMKMICDMNVKTDGIIRKRHGK